MTIKLLFAAVILCAWIKACDAYSCLKYVQSWYGTYSMYIYCGYGCCGTAYSRTCCSYSAYKAYAIVAWGVGTIVGTVIGAVVGLVVIVVIIVCVVKAVNKSGSHGRVVHPVNHGHQPNMFVTNTTSTVQSNPTIQPMPPPYNPMPPPAYPGPSVAHPLYPSLPGQQPMGPTKT